MQSLELCYGRPLSQENFWLYQCDRDYEDQLRRRIRTELNHSILNLFAQINNIYLYHNSSYTVIANQVTNMLNFKAALLIFLGLILVFTSTSSLVGVGLSHCVNNTFIHRTKLKRIHFWTTHKKEWREWIYYERHNCGLQSSVKWFCEK